MKKLLFCCLILSLMLWLPTLAAQDATTQVPDLTGLNVPQAAARLNEAGLRLGAEQVVLWTTGANGAPNTISTQSVAAGSAVAPGSAVDISVLRSPNMEMIYDDNDLTLVNKSGDLADVTGMRLASTAGGSASLVVIDRLPDNLKASQCFQFWTEWRNAPKGMTECRFIQSWVRGLNASEHFWTQTAGVQQFTVLENGVERITCPGAPVGSQDNPLRCEFFYGGTGAADITQYIYFAYTLDTLTVINQSPDKWMPTDRTTIFNPNVPDTSLFVGDPTLFQNPDVVGDITQLAPGQCLLLSVNRPDGTTPVQPCQVVAYHDVNPIFAFWTAAFEIESATDGQRHGCPAATAERPVICILPQ